MNRHAELNAKLQADPTLVKHQPATPLPWIVNDGTIGAIVQHHGPDEKLFRSIEHADYISGGGVALVYEGRDNAAYIVHAANQYGPLVEALRGVIAHEQGIVHLFNSLGEAALAAFSLECERARALLRELGE